MVACEESQLSGFPSLSKGSYWRKLVPLGFEHLQGLASAGCADQVPFWSTRSCLKSEARSRAPQEKAQSTTIHHPAPLHPLPNLPTALLLPPRVHWRAQPTKAPAAAAGPSQGLFAGEAVLTCPDGQPGNPRLAVYISFLACWTQHITHFRLGRVRRAIRRKRFRWVYHPCPLCIFFAPMSLTSRQP